MDETQRVALNRPLAEFAREVLATTHARVTKRGRHFGRLSPRQLHRLRIAAKKLRYATEFFGPLYDGRKLRDYRAKLVQLQDGLGRFNDVQTVTKLAARASRGLKGAVASEARGIMLGWSAGVQDLGARQLRRVWKGFRACEPFWK
jgi:triphosphatase